MERITSAMINEVIARGEAVRISDVASRLYTTNKQAVRKQMNKMVCRGQLSCEKIKYIGNADICIEKYNLIRSLLRCPRSKPKSKFKNL